MQSYSVFREKVRRNETSCEDELQSMFTVQNQRQNLNAFLDTNADDAIEAARESDRRFRGDVARSLEGMVVALKDNISAKGFKLTCSSRILQQFQPVYDASVVSRLRNAGAIIVGKTNCDEFAMGSSNENSAYGDVAHPFNNEYVPGGSSGGSAVAVAAGMCHAALGSDTGGSVRQPAAFCGVVGYKPSYGLVSRYGLVAFASSFDQIGPLTHSVEDAALLLDAISGNDPHDSTSTPEAATNSVAAMQHHDTKLRVGIFDSKELHGCDPEILARYHKAIEVLSNSGAQISTVHLPAMDAWIPTYYILATAEASANLARFDGVRYGQRIDGSDQRDMITASRSIGFGAEVKRRIMLGTFVLSSGYYDAYYRKGQQARRLVVDGYSEVFNQCDTLLLPTTPSTAFKRGEKSSDPISMYLSDLFTVSANLAGIPAISIPAGNNSAGFPIGLQLQAAMMDDERLLRIARHVMSLIN